MGKFLPLTTVLNWKLPNKCDCDIQWNPIRSWLSLSINPSPSLLTYHLSNCAFLSASSFSNLAILADWRMKTSKVQSQSPSKVSPSIIGHKIGTRASSPPSGVYISVCTANCRGNGKELCMKTSLLWPRRRGWSRWQQPLCLYTPCAIIYPKYWKWILYLTPMARSQCPSVAGYHQQGLLKYAESLWGTPIYAEILVTQQGGIKTTDTGYVILQVCQWTLRDVCTNSYVVSFFGSKLCQTLLFTISSHNPPNFHGLLVSPT